MATRPRMEEWLMRKHLGLYTLALATAAWALVPAAAVAQDRPWERGWGMHPMEWMWGAGGLFMMLLMVVFWGLVIAGVVVAVRWLVREGGRDRSDRPDPALQILRERYARGEIGREEFEARRRDLA
jgi:putative membrane protein